MKLANGNGQWTILNLSSFQCAMSLVQIENTVKVE